MHQSVGSCQTSQCSQHRDARAFNEDLKENRAVGGADGFACADFTDALVDAGQHDVHDADAADQKTESGDDPAADARIANALVDVFDLVLLSPKREVLDSVMGNQQYIS